MSSVIERFVRRLDRIGIDVQLSANAPWVYLDSVNGIEVTELFKAEHGFTAFWLPVNVGQDIVFSDRSAVFAKVREYVLKSEEFNALLDELRKHIEEQKHMSYDEGYRAGMQKMREEGQERINELEAKLKEKALQDMTTWQEENGLYGFIEEHVTRSYSGRQQNDDVEPKEKNI